MAKQCDAAELYRKYRPTTFREMKGQAGAIKMLMDMGKRNALPHCLLFSGPSGCGKTTLARILRLKLKCSDTDFREYNCADFRGVDTIREIREYADLTPMGGQARVWLIDEAHRLTGDAQNAFLKLLEDAPVHAYFFLATTEPNRLIATIRNRATEVSLKPLKPADMETLVRQVWESECGVGLEDEVCEKVIRLAGGSPRKALVLLSKAMAADTVEKQLENIDVLEASPEVRDLCRLLMKSDTPWNKIAATLNSIDVVESDPEGVRRAVLGYCSAALLRGGSKWAFHVIECFSEPFFNTGKPGLVAACYEVFHLEGV